MDLLEFRKEYLETVKAIAASESKGTSEAFVQATCDHLVNGEQFDDYELSYYVGRVRNSKYRLDAYSYDEYDKSMAIIIADFSGENESERLVGSEINAQFKQLHIVVKESFTGRLRDDFEMSTPAYDLVDRLYKIKNEIRKIKLYLISDKELGANAAKSIDDVEIDGVPCEHHVWDINRLQRMLDSGDGHEPIIMDLTAMSGRGIPCLDASALNIEHCSCYLSVLPGALLADIYDMYGSRLMEGNVRTFLSARGNVNKAIRRTILGDEKNMFFTYNNGIAATASDIETQVIDGQRYITKITNLQIVNGGQTTASLSNTRYKDKADLDGIFVQMKLTVVEDELRAGEIIPNISRCSNSQNKVSEADFFSNHEFNIRMQKTSRHIYAPAALGVQYETHWFYERARGQYENEQSKLTVAQKKQFAFVNPKAQLFDKTVLAKIENAWRGLPHISSAGAQKSFKSWAETIVGEWDKDSDQFNELYFKNFIATLIIFRFLEKSIPKQNWYEGSYRANIVVYTIAYFNLLIAKQYPGRLLDRTQIWNKQGLSDEMQEQLLAIAEHVAGRITDPGRQVVNVTEWCKREACWLEFKNSKFNLNANIEGALSYAEDAKSEAKESKKIRKMDNAIECQMTVINKGVDFWKSVALFAIERKILNEKEMAILKLAIDMESGKIPSEKQSKVVMEIFEKVLDEGFVEG